MSARVRESGRGLDLCASGSLAFAGASGPPSLADIRGDSVRMNVLYLVKYFSILTNNMRSSVISRDHAFFCLFAEVVYFEENPQYPTKGYAPHSGRGVLIFGKGQFYTRRN